MNGLRFRIAFFCLSALAVSACGGGSTGSVPAPNPSPLPTVAPTLKPTAGPTGKPTPGPSPSTSASPAPSGSPTAAPSASPTAGPSASPTAKPTSGPTVAPTVAPTVKPTVAPTVAPTVKPTATPSANAIQHIVVIVQENRTVDNIFQGFPNANTQSTGRMALPGGGQMTIPLQMVPLGVPCDLDHSHIAWGGDWDGGQMDGFAGPKAHIHCVGNATPPPSTYAYSYVNPADVKPYWSLAQNYTLLDNVFEDPTSPSFQSHLELISGQTNDTSENPQYQGNTATVWGCDSPVGTTVALYDGLGDKPGITPCFAAPYATVADLLDARGLSWKYYAPAIGSTGDIWSAFDAIQSVRYGPDWHNDVISPETLILSQATNLASVTYVVPSFADSDHASSNSNTGPSWVASVINAIGTSPNWSTTAIFLLWDDWGGWYDHVPPTVSANYALGGLRIPVLCISPYSENPNPASPVVDHTPHGEAGILAFIEQNFALGNLGQQDAVEAPLNDCFNFNQSPKPFITVPSSVNYPASYFRRERPSGIVPDDDK